MLFLMFVGLIDCVITNPVTRIIDGMPVIPGEMPFLGSLGVQNTFGLNHVCGATLLTPNKVITSAHCISSEVDKMRITMGEHNLRESEGTEQYLSVQSVTIHPDYNGNMAGYPGDIAIMTLTTPADTNRSQIATIPLAARGADFNNHNCTLVGWGSIFPGTVEEQNTPSKATFPVITNTVCTNLWSPFPGSDILPGHVCMFSSNGEEACHYDYGGPMVCDGTLAGVISWGDIMCNRRLPSVMSNVAYYHDWILMQL